MDSDNHTGMQYRSLQPSFLDSLSFLDSPPLLPLAPYPTATTTMPKPPPPQQILCTASAAAGVAGAGKPRSSKKRSRATRRAPTTVLTTDTSNFRAMVQEFTGIASPPFASSSPSSSSSLLSLSRFPPSDAGKSPFLLRPSPQRLQNAAVPLPTRSLTTSYDYHTPLNSQQNSFFSFQSLLLSPKYNLSAILEIDRNRSVSLPPPPAVLTPEKYGMGGVNIPDMVEPDEVQQETRARQYAAVSQ